MSSTSNRDATRRGRSVPLRPDLDLEQVTVEPALRWYLLLKYFLDFVLALVLTIILWPIVAIAAVVIRCTSLGPAFYVQQRLGRGRRPFTIFKLRTMVHNAEALTGPVWADSSDDRITRVGRILRATQIDEFPQLVNVLLGQMSLVGPRPERPEIAGRLEFEIANYSQRYQVRPGISGMAQLRLPPDTDLDSVRDKLILDLYYIRHISLWLDFRVLVCTTLYMFQRLSSEFWRRIRIPGVDAAKRRLLREHYGESECCTASTVVEPDQSCPQTTTFAPPGE